MGNVFILSALLSFLGLKRQSNPYQQKNDLKLNKSSEQHPTPQTLSNTHDSENTKQEHLNSKDINQDTQQEHHNSKDANQTDLSIQSNKVQSKAHNKSSPFNLLLQLKQITQNKTSSSQTAENNNKQSQIIMDSQQEQQLQENLTNFVFLTKPNQNILYHNPTLPTNKPQTQSLYPALTYDQLQDMFDKNLQKFNGVKPSQAKKTTSEKLSFEFEYQTRHIGFSHNIMIGQTQVKSDLHKSKLLIFIKEEIADFKDKNVSRLHQIFNFKLIQTKHHLLKILQQHNDLLQHHPAHIVCHYSLFQSLHKEYLHDFRVAKISILNSSLINPSVGNNLELLNYDQIHKFTLNNQNDPNNKIYKKLGIVSTKIFQLRQSLIQLITQGLIRQQSQPIFAQYRHFNQEYINTKEMGIRSCLKLQQFPREALLTLNQQALIQQKLKAKFDLIKLLQYTLNTEFYLEYVGSLLRKQPKWTVKNKQQLKTEYQKIEEILKPIKEYKLMPFYENHFQIDKSQIRTLQQIDQLKLLPSTNVQIFWQSVQKFLFPQESSILCVSLINNYLTHYKSPMQLQALRLYVSDLFVSIRELYKHYDQKLYEGQVYCSLNLNDNQLDLFKNTMTAENTHKRLNKVKSDKRMQIVQNQNFLIASKNKQKQLHKPGNVLLQILIKKQKRTYHIDYGFIQRQNKKLNLKAKHAKSNQNILFNSEDDQVVINILNTFYVESVQYHASSQKYIVRLIYGYVPSVSLKLYTNHLGLSDKQKAIAECYLNNQNNILANIKTQGDALYFAKMYDQSQIFFQQFLIKAKREPKTNLLKISYAFMGQYRALVKKKQYHKAQQQLFKSSLTLQKIFGQKCHQTWNNIVLEVEMYELEGQYERGVQRLSTLLSLIRSKMFEIERKPNDMLEENLQTLTELESRVNMRIGVLYLRAGKQDVSERYLKKALETATKMMGEFNPLTGQIYEKMSQFYIKYEDYEKAVFNAKKCLAINLNMHGEHSIKVAESYKGVGIAQFYHKENQLSIRNLISALSIVEQLYSQDHNQIIQLYIQIGKALHNNNSFNQALTSYFRAHFLLTYKPSTQHPQLLNELNYLMGLSYKHQGKYLQAISKFEQSNSLALHIISPNHQQQNQSVKEIAQIYQNEGKYEKAISLYQKPLLSIIRNKGKSSKDTIWYYEKIAHLYMHLSKVHQNIDLNQSNTYLSKALDYFQRIIEIRVSFSRVSFQIASSYDSIGKAYLVKQDHEHALNYFEKSLTIKKELIQNKDDNAQQNLDFSISYYLIGCAYLSAKEYDKSIEYLQKSLTIKSHKLSQTHPQIAQIYKKLGQNYTRSNNYKQAEESYKKSLTIFLSLYGSSHPQTSYIHYLIGCMYYEKGDISGKCLDHIIKAMQTVKDLGLAEEHMYQVKYSVKLKEILMYLIDRMNKQQVEPNKMLQQLKSIFFNLKIIGFQDKLKDVNYINAIQNTKSKLQLGQQKVKPKSKSHQKLKGDKLQIFQGLMIRRQQSDELFSDIRIGLLKLQEKLLDIAERQLIRDRPIPEDQRTIGQILKALIIKIETKSSKKRIIEISDYQIRKIN